MKIGENVFERTGESTMSQRGFYAALGGIVAFGLWLSSVVAAEFVSWDPSLWMILLVGLGIPLVGILLASASTNPGISFLGYLMVAIPFGMLLGPVLNSYSPEIVERAMLYTAAVTLVMGVAGLLYPGFFAKIGGALFVALIGLVVVRLISLFVPALANMTLIDYAAAGIFSLYIGYDMHRASVMPHTLDNAVDTALSLYLDIINLFMSLLRILGHSKD